MKSPLGNNPKVQALIAVFLVALITAFATRCHAQGMQFSAGGAVIRGATPALDLALNLKAPQDMRFQIGATLVGNSDDDKIASPHQMALQASIVDGFGRFDIGVGAAWLQNIDRYNSSHVNFALMVGYRLPGPWVITYRHWSNAGTVGPNLGRDMVFFGIQL